MALGFNQAGLLFATSRKSVVERKAMGVANDKIALARESQALSEDYARGQNLRKLVWEDAQGVQNDLRFSTITAPFATGNTNYIMTNVGGKMIVDSNMMKRFGLTEDTGFLTMGRNAFLAQFDDPFAANPGTKIDPTKFTPKKGINLNADELAAQMLKTSIVASDGYVESMKEIINDLKNKLPGSIGNETDDDKGNRDFYRENISDLTSYANTLYDNAVRAKNSISTKEMIPKSDPQYRQFEQYKKEVKLFGDLKNTLDRVNNAIQEGGSLGFERDISFITNWIVNGSSAKNYIESNPFWGIDWVGNNIRDTITERVGDVLGYGIGRKEENSKTLSTILDGPEIKSWMDEDLFLQNRKDGGTVDSLTTQDYVDYYDSIWKHLTYKGWIREDRVNDPKFLENSLRSGGIYMEKQDVGYSFSRVAWQTDPTCALRDVRDKTGVNLVQVQYEQRKAQLDGKEANLDVDLRNLDMERAALDAQIDTLKAVITKNVERSFKMFQA